MKRYIVEVRYTAYAQIEIEAENPEKAESLVWDEITKAPDKYSGYGDWICDSIEEQK